MLPTYAGKASNLGDSDSDTGQDVMSQTEMTKGVTAATSWKSRGAVEDVFTEA